ncbi:MULTISPECIES: cytochrome P450 [unclassified Paracoccus (in: a-proteobacteria)]|uniref:cytochrome P450 n=1 Tax=unclassified Paracoccus (in: a-proteobacteria) TaxID=2688777 RepID=UPI0012B22B76|nr:MULTISPECIES: cytochrome P450 [unclassified Paracoccus (in: a-proteobacteria)]UXU76164.1 cytochrome P450 [Paracoccus sp. SMMA_5]UXU82070.1 cytochrome P450 [Paracoccus sp. SMMA_5_TC]
MSGDGFRQYPARVALGRRPLGVIASALTARRNVLELIPEIATRQPMVSGKTGKRWHMVMDPQALRVVLKDRVEDYPKSLVTKLILGPAVGQSLFVAEAAHWRWQRRAAAPAFAQRHVEALGPVMTAAAEASARRLAAAQGPVDVFAETVAATFEVISEVTFSGDEGFDRDAVHHAIDAYIAGTARISVMDILGLPGWVPRPGRLRTGADLRRMKRVADQAIHARARSGPRPVPDLLDLLRAGVDPETGRRMSAAELRDNLLTFIVAGHETTALTLAWALYLLAFDPGVQHRAAIEADAVLGGRAATAADLHRLPYIRQIVEEALRLYPPAALLSRTALRQDELGGRQILPGDTVMLPIYALHRHHLLWDDPDRFDPDRFGPGQERDRFAFLPFGAGPRICIGASFALQEAVIILATLLTRLRFDLAGPVPQPRMILTLRPHGGVWLRVTARRGNQGMG